MASSEKVDQRQWQAHERLVRYLYLVKKISLDDLVASLQSHGLQVNKHQVERQLKRWKFQKNNEKSARAYVRDRVSRRAQDGLETDVFLSGRPIPPTVWQRRIRREFVSTIQRLNPGPRPKTPQNLDLCISTPAPLPMQFNSWPSNMPWLQSQPISTAIASIVPERPILASGDLITSALFASTGSTDLTPRLRSSINLSVAAAAIGKTIPESFEGENFIRANVLLNGEIDQETLTEAVKIMLFRLANNLNSPNHTPVLDLFLTDAVISQIPHGAVIPMEDPTIATITDKLLQNAFFHGDNRLHMTQALFRLPLDVNRPITVNTKYQMPLQAAIKHGALELTKLLIGAGADINTTFGNQRPLLVQPTKNKRLHLALQLRSMLISTRNLANENMQLNSALLSAASRCNIDLVKFLIRHGASANHCANVVAKSPFFETTVLVQALYNPKITSKRYRGSFWGGLNYNKDTDEERLKLAKYLLKPSREDGGFPSKIPAARVTPDALLAGCLSANITAVEFLHKNGADMNAYNAKGHSPLRAAVASGDPKVLTLIHTLGAKLDELATPLLGNRPSLLYFAVVCGYYSILKLLFQYGAKPDEIINTNCGTRPSLLHIAARLGCTRTVDLLIKRGLDVNSSIGLLNAADWARVSKQYYTVPFSSRLRLAKTALQVALYMKHYYCAAHLLKLGARANREDLIRAIKSKDPELVTAFLLAGGNIDETDENWKGARQVALEDGCEEIINLIAPGETTLGKDLVEEFLKGNVEWSRRTRHSESILEAAIHQRDKALIDLVFRKQPGAYDTGALCAAISIVDMKAFEDLSVVDMLLKNRSPANQSNVLEGTAIALAAIKGNSRCVNMLLDHIPVAMYCFLPYKSPHIALADNTTEMFWEREIASDRPFWYGNRKLRASPLFFAVQGGNKDIIYKLLGAGFVPDMLVLLAAITSENEIVVKTATDLMQHDGCMRGQIPEMLTPLQAAVMRENEKLVKALLDKGVDVNARPGGRRDCGGWSRGPWPPRTALQIAVEKGNLSLIKTLLDSGARVNAEASDEEGGATALQLAAIQGFLGIAKMLLDNGADVNARRCVSHGRTALEGAAEYGRLDMVQLLLTHGVVIEGKGRRQYIRAIKFARHRGHNAIERLLISQRPLGQKEMEMVEKEKLNEIVFHDPEEWSDEEERWNYPVEVEETDDEETDDEEMVEDIFWTADGDAQALYHSRVVERKGSECTETGMSSDCQRLVSCKQTTAGIENAIGESDDDWPGSWNDFVDLDAGPSNLG